MTEFIVISGSFSENKLQNTSANMFTTQLTCTPDLLTNDCACFGLLFKILNCQAFLRKQHFIHDQTEHYKANSRTTSMVMTSLFFTFISHISSKKLRSIYIGLSSFDQTEGSLGA